MAWHVYEKLLEGVANYSPFVGKIWITFLFIFRIIMVVSIGDNVYGDEQSAFVCNTLQPGCENVCFNHFSPISQIRFWAVQILFVGTPSIVFIVYAMHKMSTLQAKAGDERKPSQEDETSNNAAESNAKESKSVYISGLPEYGDLDEKRGSTKAPGSKESILKMQKNGIIAEVVKIPNKKGKQEGKIKRKTVFHKDGSTEVVKTESIGRAYVAQAILRTAIEVVFLYLQYTMYQFTVQELYVCEGAPCPKKVDCFVSRPMEKTLFLRFMYAMTGVSLLLNMIELFQLFWNGIKGHNNKINGNFRLGTLHLDSRADYYDRRRGGGRTKRRYRRNRELQTFPNLGPFPRTIGNSYGDSSGADSMYSDYRYYVSEED